MAQLPEYKATIAPRAGENVAQPCDYRALFPAGERKVKAAWVTYDRGPDITGFYSDPEVMAFAKRNDLAMVLAIQCPAKHASEQGEMDMHPEHGLGRSLFSALTKIGTESHHPELGNVKLIVLGFSGTGAYFGHFVAFAPSRVLAAILTNPGTDDPNNVDKIRLDEKGLAVPELIVVGALIPYQAQSNRTHSTSSIVPTERRGSICCKTIFPTAASTIRSPSCSTGCKQ
jgi:hypothetical protein